MVFEHTARTPFFYKNAFGGDYFGDMIAIGAAFDGADFDPVKVRGVDFTVLTQIAWACAYTADRTTPDFEEWLDTVPEFNIFEHGVEIMNMSLGAMNTKKK